MDSNDYLLAPIPLEQLRTPKELTGETGTNRAPSFITKQISANNDLQATLSWLAEFDGSPQTQRSYRKESERLLLWWGDENPVKTSNKIFPLYFLLFGFNCIKNKLSFCLNRHTYILFKP